MVTVTPRKFDGKKLRDLRNAKKWSQRELGQRIGAHTTSVSDWERGDNAPSGRYVVSLAREFGVDASEFYVLDGDEEGRSPVAVDFEAVLDHLLDRALARRAKASA